MTTQANKTTAKVDVTALQAELDMNKAMAENSPTNIILANTDLEILYVNPASVTTLGQLESLLPCKLADLLGQNIDIFHQDPSYQRNILSNPANLPHRAVIDFGGHKLDLLVSASYDAHGEYMGPMVVWEIVTEKLKLETEAAQKTALVENAPINILLADQDLNILYANPA